MKAVVVVSPGKVAVKDVPTPRRPGTGQILVKVVAAAQNPVDWKFVNYLSPPNVIVGCDFVGFVEDIGAGVPDGLRHIGERVAGFVHGGASPLEGGSFAEYVLADARIVVSVPPHIRHDEAAGFGIAVFTACQVLHQSFGFNLTASYGPATPLLVWSGATAVGQFVIQFATRMNFDVIATASPKHHRLLQSLGATAVFDYHDPNVSDQIKKHTKGALRYAVDCIAEGDAPVRVGECFGAKGGVVATLLKYGGDGLRMDVEQKLNLVFTLLGKPIQLPMALPPLPEHHAHGEQYAEFISKLLRDRALRPLPSSVFRNGLEGAQRGLDYMKAGQVSGVKIIYLIDDTPGIES